MRATRTMVILLLGMGLAAFTKADSPVIVEKPLTDGDRAHWAYGPLAPVKTPDAGSGNPVDVLLLSSPAYDRGWLKARRAGISRPI